MKNKKLNLIVLASLAVSACGTDFVPYARIEGLRLLAIGSDAPWLSPTTTSTLTALVVPPKDGPAIEYNWSWCPFPAGSDVGFECSVTREQLQQTVDGAVGPGLVMVPPFEIGTASTAAFNYGLPPMALQGLCAALTGGQLPDFVSVPDCEERFPISIRLEVKSGEASVIGIKKIYLAYDDLDLNTNPVIEGAAAIEPDTGDMEIEISEDGATTLKREVEYKLRLSVPESSAETFMEKEEGGTETTEQRERLVISWFVQAGEPDKTRTSFVDGQISMEKLRENLWATPKPVDFEDPAANLYFVIRDGRGGVSWLTRQVRF